MNTTEILIEKIIPYQTAYNAYRNVSFSPERRAETTQKECIEYLTKLYGEFEADAKNEAQKEILLNEFARFKENYSKHYCHFLNAQSRTASTMITGGSNFNHRQNDKREKWVRSAWDTFSEWNKKAIASIEKKIKDAREETDIKNEFWARFEEQVISSIDTIIKIDEGKAPYSRPLIVKNLQSRIETQAKNGQKETVTKALDLIKRVQETHFKPIFAANNSIWGVLDRMEVKEAVIEEVKAIGNTSTVFNGVEVINNVELERLQLKFEGKPAPEVITALKKSGWRWSPSNGCWQRQNTNNALYSAKQIISQFYK